MRIVLIIFILGLVFFSLQGMIIEIPTDYQQIQAGIDSTVDGDTVLVYPGTYYENINYNDHNITVGSLFLTTQDSSYIEQTIIDGANSGSVVTFIGDKYLGAILCGFIITNGSGNIMPNNYYCGGGIFCLDDADPTIINCIITNNIGDDGGGVFAYLFSDPTFVNCEIINNYSNDDGGGIHCNHASSPSFYNCKISNNTCIDKGAGICIGHNEHTSNIIMDHVEITHNTSYEKGGAIYSANSISSFTNVTICDNYSIYSGLYCQNSTFYIKNSIIRDNYPIEIYLIDAELNVSYTNIFNYYQGFSNIDQDPLFINPFGGNYHLQANSPCIDAGDPNSTPDPDGSISDMGAYFYTDEYILSANFYATPQNGEAPLEVSFTDLSVGNIISWQWDFNCDGTIDSYEQNPIYIYELPGFYNVQLTVSDGNAVQSEIKYSYISVNNINSSEENNLYDYNELMQNYPNPFSLTSASRNPQTTISFSVKNSMRVSVEIFNLKGQNVKTILDQEISAGLNNAIWDGKDKNGQFVKSGIYLYHLIGDNKLIATKKMILVK